MEGFSQGLLEAMALGKPVIASAATGNLELITDDVDGRLVAPLDPAAWAAAIDQLLGDATLAHRLGANGRDTARHRFSLDHTVARTLDLYRSVVGEAKFLGVPSRQPEETVRAERVRLHDRP
jgi:glycosyltransferase involved in cell wall biosynthesis